MPKGQLGGSVGIRVKGTRGRLAGADSRQQSLSHGCWLWVLVVGVLCAGTCSTSLRVLYQGWLTNSPEKWLVLGTATSLSATLTGMAPRWAHHEVLLNAHCQLPS